MYKYVRCQLAVFYKQMNQPIDKSVLNSAPVALSLFIDMYSLHATGCIHFVGRAASLQLCALHLSYAYQAFIPYSDKFAEFEYDAIKPIGAQIFASRRLMNRIERKRVLKNLSNHNVAVFSTNKSCEFHNTQKHYHHPNFKLLRPALFDF